MSESEINLETFEKKIMSNQINSPQKQIKLNQGFSKSNSKKEIMHKTFYNFQNMYKIQDFKQLTASNFNSSAFNDHQRKVLLASFKNNVATFLILKKYKNVKTNFRENFSNEKQKTNKNKKENSLDLNFTKEKANIFNENINIDVLFYIEEKDKIINHRINSQKLQEKFIQHFIENQEEIKFDSEKLIKKLTNSYDNLLKNILGKTLKIIINEKGLEFENFELQNENDQQDDLLKVVQNLFKEQYEEIKEQISFPTDFQIPEIKENIVETHENKEKISYFQQVFLEKIDKIEKPHNEEKSSEKMNIIDQLLQAKDIFDVNLDFLRPKITYPEMPEIQFKDDEEKIIFTEIHNWLYEMETELEDENRVILEYKKNKLGDDFEMFPKENSEHDEEESEEENQI